MIEDKSQNIISVNIEDEMKSAYIDYSMSVIVSRALPDVRDGLKPVHRRVLFGMLGLGVSYNKSFKKCARIVGEVMGKYHPHGDSSVYDTMVRMAQEWSLRYTLVDGQGNFGSIDGDSPAAMRYTEAKLKKISDELLSDINKETVDFQPNFDDTLNEPTVLPAKFPNLLVNGSSGIAVGMATNMAPHNLSEVIDGTIHYIDNNDCSIDDLVKYIKAPDFPTGGIIYGYQGVKSAFETGKGRIVMRAKATININENEKNNIIVTEIPYMVNKANMIEKTAYLINEKKLEGITDIRDESDRNGLRIVYELKRDSIPNVILNNLYKYTQLQSSFGVNNVALVKGRPKILNLKELIENYVEHRHDVVLRRIKYDLKEAEKRSHILKGYIIALDNIDDIINMIKKSKNPEEAKLSLIKTYKLSEIQSKAILEMRLQKLTGLEREKINKENDEINKLINYLNDILSNKDQRMNIIKDELNDIKNKYGDKRKSEIEHSAEEFTVEDMIPDEDMVITVSHQGYLKRTSLDEYRTQGRGGLGARGVKTKDDDFNEHLFIASTHNYLLIFTEYGKIFWKKVWEIPEGSKVSKGRAIQNLINIEPGDNIRSIITITNLTDEDYLNNNYLVMCTERGQVKKTKLEAYSRPRVNGIYAITIKENDRLLDVKLTNGNNHIIIAKKSGKAINFHENNVRPMGRTASGVRGVRLENDEDKVIGMICVAREESDLLVVSQNGYGKRSSIRDYRITKRGGKGVMTLKTTEKTGYLVAIKEVKTNDELMIINKSGIAIRTKITDKNIRVIRLAVENLRTMGRATQGVKLIRLSEGDEISSVAKIETIKVEEI